MALSGFSLQAQAFDFTPAEINFARAYAHESVESAYQGQNNLVTLALNEGKRPFELVNLTTLLNTYDENECRAENTYEKGYWALYRGTVYRVGKLISPMEKDPQFYVEMKNPSEGEYRARLYFLNQGKALDELIPLKRNQTFTFLCQDEGLKEGTVNFTCYSHAELFRKIAGVLDERLTQYQHGFTPHKDIVTAMLRNSMLFFPTLPQNVKNACEESESACVKSYLAFRGTPEFVSWIKKRQFLVPGELRERVDKYFRQAR